jgi:phosphotransferase system IIB component
MKGAGVEDRARQFIETLGGPMNIIEIEGCITRLRGTLADPALVDLKRLQLLGVIGRPIILGKGVQIVVGTHAELIGTAMNKLLRQQKK